MIILPAIDIIDGKPVRLYQGDYRKKEVVADSVLDTAKRFEKDGAEYLHIVDLDGAKAGKRINHELIVSVAQSVSVPVEVGGGIRTMEDITWYLKNGVSRVILGTAAMHDERLLEDAVTLYGDRISVGMDCRNGYAMGEGWLEKSGLYYLDFAKKLEETGVKNIIFTDISRDGTLRGPNVRMLEKLSDTVNINITASGGIHNMEDIRELSSMHLYGAITGKAVYSGAIDLKEAIRIGREEKTC